jgi:RsiW-degrading membrane proteinase PrsW (M82 family)
MEIIALALAPGVMISLYIYLRDKYEREPFTMVVWAIFLGVVSTGLTLIIAGPFSLMLDPRDQHIGDQLFHAFVQVSLVEEPSKFLCFIISIYRRKDFNEPFDGIVYAVLIGMGFATVENVLYVSSGGVEVGILRMFTAVPAHMTFGVLMGYFLGVAKFSHRALRFQVLGLTAAVVFHGFYDFFLFISYIPGIYVGAFVSLAVALYLSRLAIRRHVQQSPFKNKINKV